MKILLSFNGYFRKMFEQNPVEIEMVDGAAVDDIFIEIDRLYGATLPKAIWSHEKKRFRGPISVSVDQKVVKDFSYILKDGQQVSITRFLIGG